MTPEIEAKIEAEINLFENQFEDILPTLPKTINTPRMKMLIIRLLEVYDFNVDQILDVSMTLIELTTMDERKEPNVQ
jgi:hypothetical protein